MTVGELIAALSKLPYELPVYLYADMEGMSMTADCVFIPKQRDLQGDPVAMISAWGQSNQEFVV